MRDTSQPAISRYMAELLPIVKAVLEEFAPSAEDAIEIVNGRIVLAGGLLIHRIRLKLPAEIQANADGKVIHISTAYG